MGKTSEFFLFFPVFTLDIYSEFLPFGVSFCIFNKFPSIAPKFM